MPRRRTFIDKSDVNFIAELNAEFDDIDRSLERLRIVKIEILGVILGTERIQVSHSLGRVPKRVFITPRSQGTWWFDRLATSDIISIQADQEMTVDIVVEG